VKRTNLSRDDDAPDGDGYPFRAHGERVVRVVHLLDQWSSRPAVRKHVRVAKKGSMSAQRAMIASAVAASGSRF
jgi:hypothetical protein